MDALNRLAQGLASETGSQAWYLAQSNRGEQLLTSSKINEAAQVFTAVLQALGEGASFDRAQTLGRLGRCSRDGGRPDVAADYQRQALAVLDKLETSDYVKGQCGAFLTDLADALMEMGKYAEARQAYTAGFAIYQELKDLRNQVATLGELGTLALMEGNMKVAAKHHQEALSLSQTLQEPDMEAVAWQQLGNVFQIAKQWDKAEDCYREAVRIKVALGHLSGSNGAAGIWNNLAILNQLAGKPEAAEQWFRKAIAVDRDDNNAFVLSLYLNNLAELLRNQTHRLTEARQLAEEALNLKQTLEPGVAEIWKTYELLARINEQETLACQYSAYQQKRQQAARDYRRLARDAYRAFPGNRVRLKQFAGLILGVCLSCKAVRQEMPWYKRWQRKPVIDSTTLNQVYAVLAQRQEELRQGGRPDDIRLADALDRLLVGERNADTLCEGLVYDFALIMETILQGIDDLASVAWLGEQGCSMLDPLVA